MVASVVNPDNATTTTSKSTKKPNLNQEKVTKLSTKDVSALASPTSASSTKSISENIEMGYKNIREEVVDESNVETENKEESEPARSAGDLPSKGGSDDEKLKRKKKSKKVTKEESYSDDEKSKKKRKPKKNQKRSQRAKWDEKQIEILNNCLKKLLSTKEIQENHLPNLTTNQIYTKIWHLRKIELQRNVELEKRGKNTLPIAQCPAWQWTISKTHLRHKKGIKKTHFFN